jgi:class 3 adenylate cyclase
VKRKIAAILAADAVGYSRLVADDEEDTLARLASYQTVFSEFIKRFGGRIFNTAGDAILAEFESAVDAVRCAVDIQESLRARNLAYPPSRQLSFRIGITIGDVVERDGDLLGDGVNVAARLESVSPNGGICISRSVHEAVANKLSVVFADQGQQHLKNIPDPVHAYLVAVMLVVAGIAGFIFAGREESEPSAVLPTTPTADASRPDGVETDSASSDTSSPSSVEEDTSDPPATTQDTPTYNEGRASSRDKRPPFRLPTSDLAARQAILKRQWRDCHEGDEPKRRLDSCTALIDYDIYEGADLASIYVELGRAQRATENDDAAIRSYSEAIRLKPSARVYNNRGIAHFGKGDWQRAIDDYTQAIRLDSRYGEAFNNRAWTQVKAGRATRALNDAQKAVNLLPKKSYAWDTRAHVYEALGNRRAAIRDYRKALDLDPENEGSRSGLKRLGVQP